MAPTKSRKKRQTGDFTLHSRCKRHRDQDKRRTTYNGIRKNGDRYAYKVKCTQRQAQLAAGFLPVYQNHIKQELTAGHCKAVASCRQRCNRLMP